MEIFLVKMFVYSIFSDKNRLRDLCRLPINAKACFDLQSILGSKFLVFPAITNRKNFGLGQ